MRATHAMTVAFLSLTLTIATGPTTANTQTPTQSYQLDIPAGDLTTALNQLAKQTGTDLVYRPEQVQGLKTSGVTGQLTPQEAIAKLLKGTPLTLSTDATGAMLIAAPFKQSAAATSLSTLEEREGPRASGKGEAKSWFTRLARGSSNTSAESSKENSSDSSKDETETRVEEVIVTGVFKRLDKQNAAIAITTIDEDEIKATAPIAAFDLLRSVPGVYVDSSRGAVGATLSSRGSDAISILEDGLPLFNPTQLLRSDLTLARVEAVRGGSSAVVGSNAPGGIVNYISKTGGQTFASEMTAGYNRQGNGDLPGYSFDMNLGGPISNGWNYNVGGFYRHDYGSHDSGYATNFGFQVKGNLVKKFERGSLKIYAKWLDDHNGYNDSVPAVNYGSPRPAVGFDEVSYGGPPALSYRYQTGPNSFATYDTRDLTHNESRYAGIEFNMEIGAGWQVNNNVRYVRDRLNMSITSRPYPSPLDDFAGYALLGTLGIPGTYTITDPATGRSAQVSSASGFFNLAGDAVILSNSLPAAALGAYALNQSADVVTTSNDQWIEQLTVTKEFDRMSFTGGVFINYVDVEDRNKIVGFGFSTFEPQPHMLDVTLQVAGGGPLLQVTNPNGFGGPNTFANVGNTYHGYEMAYFFGHRWDFVDRWTLDWGVRLGTSSGSGGASAPGSISVPIANGGLDGDPNTLYDNQYVVNGPFIDVDRSKSTASYSAAINYAVNERNSIYARYSSSEVANVNFMGSLNDPLTASVTPWIPKENLQAELGYKLIGHGYDFAATAYDSVQNSQTFANLIDPGSGDIVIAFGPENETHFYGVELEGAYQFNDHFALRSSLNWQKGELVHSYTFNGITAVDSNAGNEATTPDVLFTLTPSYSNGRFYGQLQWRYTGDRQANNANAFVLPAYHLTDLNLQWRARDNMDLSFNVTNIFNRAGPMQWNPGGSIITFPDSITKQQIEANPNQVFVILPIQARAYYLKFGYRF